MRPGLSKVGPWQGLEGREAVAIIVDDSTRVWPHHGHNLLAVERYLWFPSSRRHFGLPGKSLMQLHRCALGSCPVHSSRTVFQASAMTRAAILPLDPLLAPPPRPARRVAHAAAQVRGRVLSCA